jgi:hypothetical protein
VRPGLTKFLKRCGRNQAPFFCWTKIPPSAPPSIPLPWRTRANGAASEDLAGYHGHVRPGLTKFLKRFGRNQAPSRLRMTKIPPPGASHPPWSRSSNDCLVRCIAQGFRVGASSNSWSRRDTCASHVALLPPPTTWPLSGGPRNRHRDCPAVARCRVFDPLTSDASSRSVYSLCYGRSSGTCAQIDLNREW